MSHVILESERVLLRRLAPEDAPALGTAMRDANVTETTLFEPPARTSEEGTERALARIADFSGHWSRHGFGIFGAFDRRTDALIGYCGLRHIDDFDDDLHISTMVDRPYWSGGLASEIVRRNLEYAFLDLDLDVVYAATRPFQLASVRLMEILGFDRLPDRNMRHWPMIYAACRKETFLKQHVVFLKQQLIYASQNPKPKPATRILDSTRPRTQTMAAAGR